MADHNVAAVDSLEFREQAIRHCPAVFDLDLTLDYEVFDNKEEVTYTRKGGSTRQPSGKVTTVDDQVFTIRSALRHMVTERDLRVMEGYVQVDDVKWDIPTDEMSVTPKIGDAIVDANGITYRVIGFAKKTLKSRWHLFGRRA